MDYFGINCYGLEQCVLGCPVEPQPEMQSTGIETHIHHQNVQASQKKIRQDTRYARKPSGCASLHHVAARAWYLVVEALRPSETSVDYRFFSDNTATSMTQCSALKATEK